MKGARGSTKRPFLYFFRRNKNAGVICGREWKKRCDGGEERDEGDGGDESEFGGETEEGD